MDDRKFEWRGLNIAAHVSKMSLVVTADAHRSYAEKKFVEAGGCVESVRGGGDRRRENEEEGAAQTTATAGMGNNGPDDGQVKR